MSDVELQNVLGFDEEDLAANRRGRLSTRQAKRIRNAQRLHSMIFAGVGILSILAGISMISAFTAPQNRFGNTTAMIGLPVIALVFIAWGSSRISTQKVDETVRCIRGKVRFIKIEKVIPEKKPNGMWLYRTVEDFQLQVGNIIFENFNHRIFKAIKEQEIYTFYYAKNSRDILSAE